MNVFLSVLSFLVGITVFAVLTKAGHTTGAAIAMLAGVVLSIVAFNQAEE